VKTDKVLLENEPGLSKKKLIGRPVRSELDKSLIRSKESDPSALSQHPFLASTESDDGDLIQPSHLLFVFVFVVGVGGGEDR
jgi:hypothetical protein